MIEITDPKELEFLKSQEKPLQEIDQPTISGRGTLSNFAKKTLLEKEQQNTNVENMGLTEITNPNEIEFLKSQEEGTISKYFKKGLLGTADFFTGTKRTEFPDVPELSDLGSYGAGKAAKVILGVGLTPNQKAQAQIIQAQIPGTKIVQDKFENPMAVMPDGKTFYLNKPGFSNMDVLETTSQILQYIPGYSYLVKKAGQSIIKRGIAAGVAGGATSLTQDIAAMPLGSKEIDTTKFAINVVAPFAFESVINPLATRAFKKIFSNDKFVDEVIDEKTKEKLFQLNDKGKSALKDAGVDYTDLDNQGVVKQFAFNLSKGIKSDIAANEAKATGFGFKLSASQAIGDEAGIGALYEAAKGTGVDKETQRVARDFLKQQNIDIELSAKSLLDRFNKGELEKETLDQAGETIKNAISSRFQKLSDKITTAYNVIDKDAIFNAGSSNIKVLPTSIEKSIIENGTSIIDKELTPATVRGVQYIKSFVNKYAPQPVVAVNKSTLKDFETLRKNISGLIDAAKNPTDKKNVIAIKNEYDKFYDDAVDNLLFGSGDNPAAIDALKEARSLYRQRQLLFGTNVIKKNGISIDDRAGKVIQKILHDPDVTPSKTIDYVFGLGQLGKNQDSLKIVRRLKNIFGVEGEDLTQQAIKNPDFQSLRTASFERLIRDSVGRDGVFSPSQFVNIFNTANTRYKDLLKELFSQKEISLISDFVNTVKKTFVPKDLANYSNTASALSRAAESVGRSVLGIVGFKIGNIQGLLAARNAFDRSVDFITRRTAKKGIAIDLSKDPRALEMMIRPTTPASVLAAETELVPERRTIYAPQMPQGLINSRQ